MKFRPGQSGNPHGRPKGTRNKIPIKTREELWAYIEIQTMAGLVANPFQVLVDTMTQSDEPAVKMTCAQALADRLLPKLKAVEVRGSDEHPLRVLLERLDREPYAAVLDALSPDTTLRLPHETA